MAERECCVCGGKPLGVCASSMRPISDAWCRECLEQGLEPWSFIVGGLAGISSKESLRVEAHPQIEANLKYYGKTWEDLFAEIRKLESEYEKYLDKMRRRDT